MSVHPRCAGDVTFNTLSSNAFSEWPESIAGIICKTPPVGRNGAPRFAECCSGTVYNITSPTSPSDMAYPVLFVRYLLPNQSANERRQPAKPIWVQRPLHVTHQQHQGAIVWGGCLRHGDAAGCGVAHVVSKYACSLVEDQPECFAHCDGVDECCDNFVVSETFYLNVRIKRRIHLAYHSVGNSDKRGRGDTDGQQCRYRCKSACETPHAERAASCPEHAAVSRVGLLIAYVGTSPMDMTLVRDQYQRLCFDNLV
ncbi:hypothetical protein CSAL01_04582 [Colletotrichum salicis]|uniref:Uncharacterized protein n=1 Tax=Colletotrichum salicis TaxID=1209931 RepID=A0A135V4C5_9PEZI|nr:hypothetical protein CSAL01_04582 [Colletotrichum salicis]